MSRRRPLLVTSTLIALALVLGGCRRKAPGPDECREFAYHVHGVTHGEDVRLPRVRAEVDDLTRECLVTPYDREYLECVEASGNESRRVRRCSS